MYQDPHGCADCIDGFILVVKQPNMIQNVFLGVIVRPEHLVWKHAPSGSITGEWLVNNDVDLDTCWTVD